MKVNLKKLNAVTYLVLAFLCLMPFVTAPLALFLGLTFALTLGTPFPAFNKKVSKYLLQISVVGLGFGMNLQEALKAGSDGIIFTLFSVISVMFFGLLIGKWLGISKVPSYLIASGTAICGGSAIAAVGPIAKANESEMSVSLATIYVLNAVALFLFCGFREFASFDSAPVRAMGCHCHSRYEFSSWSWCNIWRRSTKSSNNCKTCPRFMDYSTFGLYFILF